MIKDIYIIGAGGLGKEVAWLIEEINQVQLQWNLKGFIDDNKSPDTFVSGVPVLGNIDWLMDKSVCLICAVGDVNQREKIVNKLKLTKNTFATLIHPSISLSSNIHISEGSILFNGVMLTVDIFIGIHVIIYNGSNIFHDCEIGNFSTIAPGVNIAGKVKISNFVFIGVGSNLKNNITIEKNVLIGAGSVVINNISKNSIVAGVPARIINKLKSRNKSL